MLEIDISRKLARILHKLSRKDKARYGAVLKKMKEVSRGDDLQRYKNLRYDMKDFKRVHIDSHFVLTFMQEGNRVMFLDLQHHDDIYE